MRILNIAVLASTLMFSPFALADHDADHCDRHGKDMSKADKNGDGFLDKEEAKAMHEKHFSEADTNHDGKLSTEEIKACKHDGRHEKHDMQKHDTHK